MQNPVIINLFLDSLLLEVLGASQMGDNENGEEFSHGRYPLTRGK